MDPLITMAQLPMLLRELQSPSLAEHSERRSRRLRRVAAERPTQPAVELEPGAEDPAREAKWQGCLPGLPYQDPCP
ncbi:MAG: hypothetical protein JWQ95_4469 [Sphaerisporangium sp.]|jgi:hypothetical protein|nr:hypothetical protein [Sphaerisporangium sp.]